MPFWLTFVIGAGLCWGTYVPLLQQGQAGLAPAGGPPAAYAAFLGVGVAYFLLAVAWPLAMIATGAEKPGFTRRGLVFGLLGGAAGAFGALCVVFAIKSGGDKRFIAPVIFALAPVINTVVSLFWHPNKETSLRFGRPEHAPPLFFYAGILCAGLGAGLVLFAKESAETSRAISISILEPWLLFVIGAGLCWGTYVPIIQQAQLNLKQPSGKPGPYTAFLCVGVAYFAIAVVFPFAMISGGAEAPNVTMRGSIFALLAGAAGALGALCVIFAIKSGGDKRFVAPVIFALAPVINTVVSLFWHPDRETPFVFHLPESAPAWFFYLGIVLAGAGAGIVLFAKEAAEVAHAKRTPAAKANSAEGKK